MPRIRTIKPEIWLSPQVMNLSPYARLLFLGLITQADDYGRGTADPRKLKAAIFPGDDDIASSHVLAMLKDVENQGLAITYDANGHGRVYALTTWSTHQKVEKRKDSVYPEPSPTDPRPGGDQAGPSRGGSDLIRSDPTGSDRKDLTRAHDPVNNGDNSARGARGTGRLKKSAEENRSEIHSITHRLAAKAKAT